MPAISRKKWLTAIVVVGCLSVGAMGCQTCSPCLSSSPFHRPWLDCKVPREFDKTTMPTYVIEPPDILLIDAVRLIPLPPYKVEPFDVLIIVTPNTPEKEPIAGPYTVEPDGTVNLGFRYGSVNVLGMTLVQAKAAIEKYLKAFLNNPETTVSLGQSRGLQQIRGEHLVRPDGTVNLGSYGPVQVAGLSLPEAKKVLEAHLGQFLDNPEITLDIGGYNSKVYYIVMDGAGSGEQIFRFPITGNETVLDAMAQVGGLSAVSSKRRIWIARPAPGEVCCRQTLPVNWKDIVRNGDARTNYQLLPGDRLYVDSAPMITASVIIARVTAPIEQLFGITLLGQGTVRAFGNQGQGAGGAFFGF